MTQIIKVSSRRTRPSETHVPVNRLGVGPEDLAGIRSDSALIRYWTTTRQPIPNLIFLVPLLVIYEVGVFSLAGDNSYAVRAGADFWLRRLYETVGLFHHAFLPSTLVAGLIGWQAAKGGAWKFSPAVMGGMVVESLVFAVGLVGLSKLVDLGFERIDEAPMLAVPALKTSKELLMVIGFLGAGIYEETIFRLALIPSLYWALRSLQMPGLGANVLAVTLSSLLFSLAHHVGVPGLTFSWYAFIFRWLAGVYFAWIFVMRGFGVAVATHAAYDVLVGYFDWSF